MAAYFIIIIYLVHITQHTLILFNSPVSLTPPPPLSPPQRQQNTLKYVTEDWASIEYELLRERGLWGPPIGSHLDKFVLEMTEGPCRMRKKMVRNDMFYIHYPYNPEMEPSTNPAQVRPRL